MADLDQTAIVSEHISERALIENAGRALAQHVHERYPARAVVVLVGSGHNGADALVAGRTLAAWGRPVRFVRCGGRLPEPDVLSGWGLQIEEPEVLGAALAEADVVIDGILGTGVETAPRPPQAEIIRQANRARAPVVAVDGPSGVDFTTGRVEGAAIQADLTVTLGWPKLGLLRFPARGRCGDLICVEIGFPPPAPQPRARAVTCAWAADLLGDRPANAHKGDAGYLAIVAGKPGMAGAAVLAARSAIRAGAGIVRVVSAPENREILQTAIPEAVFVDWTDADAVDEAVAWAHAVVVGPGLGTEPARAALLARVLGAGGRAVVIDADGLNLWAAAKHGNPGSGSGLLLTPHPGEMARLLGSTVEEITEDPAAAARELSGSTGATVLLKGAPSWVAGAGGRLRVSTLLSPGFATGGMGDILSGVCGAYMAAGLAPADAATAALCVTALAVLAIEGAGGPVGGSSADVPARLPAAREALRRVRPGAWAGVCLALPAVEPEPGPSGSRHASRSA